MKTRQFLIMSALILSPACVAPSAFAQGTGATSPSVSVKLSGAPETVYDWKKDHCEQWMVPDAPVRALVDASGKVVLFSANASNWSMTGSSLDKLVKSCGSAFKANQIADPKAFDAEGWIEATFTQDGSNVLALVSNDWSPKKAANPVKSAACPAVGSSPCDYMSITIARSSDGGKTFKYQSGAHVLAAMPFSQLSNKHPMICFATASNMIEAAGYIYTFLGARAQSPAQTGSCIFRTSVASNGAAWEYWNGKAFAQLSTEGNADLITLGSAVNCSPVSIPVQPNAEIRSVAHFADCNCYIGTFQGMQKGRSGQNVPGFFLTSSRDLLSWSEPNLIMSLPEDADCKEILAYPSLLDPNPHDRNFADVTRSPYLYYTRMNRTSCKGTTDRDLVRVPLTLGLVTSGAG
jgi:hypothetical protein